VAFRQKGNQGTFRRGGPKRLTEWGICTVPTGFSNIVPGKTILVLVPAATLQPESPATVVRSRFMLSIGSDQSAANEAQVGAFGIGFVNEVAGALGVTGVPGPATDCAWGGWFVWQAFLQENSTGTDQVASSISHYVIDSKAMRKFTEDESLVMVIENTAGSDGLRAAVAGRMLVKAG